MSQPPLTMPLVAPALRLPPYGYNHIRRVSRPRHPLFHRVPDSDGPARNYPKDYERHHVSHLVRGVVYHWRNARRRWWTHPVIRLDV